MHPHERMPEAVEFLHGAMAYCAGLGVSGNHLLTDEGTALRRPQTDGKAWRTIHSALRDWIHGRTAQNSAGRTDVLTQLTPTAERHRVHCSDA